MTLPDCQVRLSHSIQTFKSTCTFCWSLCSWTNNVDDFFPKNIQECSMVFRSESCFLRSRKTRKMLWIILPRFPAGAGTQEMGSKRNRKQGKEEFLKGKCNQGQHIPRLIVPACPQLVFLRMLHVWDPPQQHQTTNCPWVLVWWPSLNHNRNNTIFKFTELGCDNASFGNSTTLHLTFFQQRTWMTSEPIPGHLGRLFIPFRTCSQNTLNSHGDERRSVLLAQSHRDPLVDCHLHRVCRCRSLCLHWTFPSTSMSKGNCLRVKAKLCSPPRQSQPSAFFQIGSVTLKSVP